MTTIAKSRLGGLISVGVAICLVTTVLVAGPPVATDDAYITPPGENLRLDPPGVLANDTDPDEETLTAFLVDPPSPEAVLDLAPDGSFEYEPPEGFEGTDSFTYRAFDGTAFSNVAVVEIDVTPSAVGFGIHHDAAVFVDELAALGCSPIHEGFEDDGAWAAARHPLTATSVTSQGMLWTANNPDSGVTTGPGPVRTGQYGFFTLPHGNYATGVDCHIAGNCTDGWIGTAATGLCGVGGWLEGNYGKIELFIDGDRMNPISFGANSGVTYQHKFFGVILPDGFTSFEVHETEGKAEDQKIIFADDFWYGFLPAGLTLSARRAPGLGDVTLRWLGGAPTFSVYRSDVAQDLYDPVNLLGQTPGREWVDTPPVGELWFYGVLEP
jgi:hypothetical protein